MDPDRFHAASEQWVDGELSSVELKAIAALTLPPDVAHEAIEATDILEDEGV